MFRLKRNQLEAEKVQCDVCGRARLKRKRAPGEVPTRVGNKQERGEVCRQTYTLSIRHAVGQIQHIASHIEDVQTVARQ